jgi:hypothetical protein
VDTPKSEAPAFIVEKSTAPIAYPVPISGLQVQAGAMAGRRDFPGDHAAASERSNGASE